MSARPCGTCEKPCYPKEKISISDVWLHRACLKCSVCSTTLSLNSVYVSVAEGSKKIYCKVDVPRAIHTAIVDSIALRRAISAPRPSLTSSTSAQLPGNGGKGSMRFKGLTLRSKGMKSGLEAQGRRGGVDMGFGRVVVGNARGSTLDSWDIQHAIEVQSQVSSPMHSHPALTAQLTGSQPGHFLSPSILSPQITGRENQQPSWVRSDAQDGQDDAAARGDGEAEDDGIAREKKGVKEVVNVEKDLVKNLLKAFQLDTLSIVELPPLGPNPGHHQPQSPSTSSTSSILTPSPSTLANTAANSLHPTAGPPSHSPPAPTGGLMAPPPTPVAKRVAEGKDMFASIKLPGGTLGTLGHARMDLINVVGTLGTRKGFNASSSAKPGLKGLFDPPSAEPSKTQRAKSVRIASGKPSIIELFGAEGQSVVLPDSDDEEEEEEEEDGEEMSEEIGDEEFARRMETQGLEVTLIYEEVVEPGVVQE